MGDTFKFKPMHSRVSEDKPVDPSFVEELKEMVMTHPSDKLELQRQRDAARALRRSKTKNSTPQTSDD